MKLNVKAVAISLGLVWGVLAVFATSLVNLAWPGYGEDFLWTVASIYPGFEVGSVHGLILGTLYGLADGAVVGAVYAWIYNRVVGAA